MNEDIFTGKNLGVRLSQEFTLNCFSTNPSVSSGSSSDVKGESGASGLDDRHFMTPDSHDYSDEADKILKGNTEENVSEKKPVGREVTAEVKNKKSVLNDVTRNVDASLTNRLEKCPSFRSPQKEERVRSNNNLILCATDCSDIKPSPLSQHTDSQVIGKVFINSTFCEKFTDMKLGPSVALKPVPNLENVKVPLWYNSLMNEDIITGKNLGNQLAAMSPNSRGVKRKRKLISPSPSLSSQNQDKHWHDFLEESISTVNNGNSVNSATKGHRRSKRSRKSIIHKNCKLACCHTPKKAPIKKLSLRRLSSANSTWEISGINSSVNKKSPKISPPAKRRKSVLGDWGVRHNTFLQCLLNSSPLEQFHTMKLSTPTKRKLSLMDDLGRISKSSVKMPKSPFFNHVHKISFLKFRNKFLLNPVGMIFC